MSRENQEAVGSALTHRIELPLISGAHLKLLYFSEGEMRWIFPFRLNSGETAYFELPMRPYDPVYR